MSDCVTLILMNPEQRNTTFPGGGTPVGGGEKRVSGDPVPRPQGPLSGVLGGMCQGGHGWGERTGGPPHLSQG